MDFLQFIPAFGNLAFTIAAFVVALLVIVAVHEYGHYIVGRWTGIRAEVFSIGFGPVLWSRHDKRGTKWQIAAIPLGGFVRFLGDSDAASMNVAEGETLDPKAARHTMRHAPLWARASTVAAGPVFNFIFSIVVFTALILYQGVASDPLTIEKLPAVPYEHGLKVGDEIVGINGQDAPDLPGFQAFARELPTDGMLDYRVMRDGQTLTVPGPNPYPPLIAGITPGSAADDAGLRIGEVITAVNGTPVHAFSELQSAVGEAGGSQLTLTIWDDGDSSDVALSARRTDLPLPDGGFETRWLLGISGGLWFQPETVSPGLWQSFTMGVRQTSFIIESSLSGFYHMITGAISSCNIRGPIGIAETSGSVAAQGLVAFIGFVGLLSTAVGLLNLFPIPVLDGGHLLFHAYEAVVGRPPGERALRLIMTVGLALIVTLMLFGLSNDLLCP